MFLIELLLVPGICCLVIGATLAIVDFFTSTGLKKTCTKTVNGAYVGNETVRVGNRSNHNTIVYDLAKYGVGDETITARMGISRGIRLSTPIGAPLVVHYDPDNPSKCWGHTPDIEVGSSKDKIGLAKWISIAGVVLLVLFAVIELTGIA